MHAIEGRRTTLRTDDRPLVFMFTQKTEKLLDRQARHIAFLSKFLHDVEHVSGESNVVPDALSRLELAALLQDSPDLNQWATDQANDAELQKILSGNTPTSLLLNARTTTSGPSILTRPTTGRGFSYQRYTGRTRFRHYMDRPTAALRRRLDLLKTVFADQAWIAIYDCGPDHVKNVKNQRYISTPSRHSRHLPFRIVVWGTFTSTW